MGSGSKIDVHTVLKLIELAMTAMYTSSGANSGVAMSSTWIDFRGSFVRRVETLEHVGLVAADEGRAERLGNRDRRQLVAGCVGLDRCKDLLHTDDITRR